MFLWQDIANDGYGPFAVTVYLIVMAAVVGILRQHFLTAAVYCMLMCAVYNYIQGGWSEVIEYSLLDYVITGTVLEIIAVAVFLIFGFQSL